MSSENKDREFYSEAVYQFLNELEFDTAPEKEFNIGDRVCFASNDGVIVGKVIECSHSFGIWYHTMLSGEKEFEVSQYVLHKY